MIFSQSPIIFIACILGMAFLAILICFGFFISRHRSFLLKPADAEQGAGQTSMVEEQSPQQRHHPPVYCIDDIDCPPPSYQAVFTRPHAPSHREMRILRRRLEKLQRRRGSDTANDVPATPEMAIRDSEIRCLTQWIERLEMLREEEGEQDAGRLFSPHQTLRLVHSESQPVTLPTRSATMRGAPAIPGSTRLQRSATEPGLVQFARSRDVEPPPTPTYPPSSPTPGGLDIRFTELREQIMRRMGNRYSAER
ncbi:hypothetical protein NLG97_g3282 [Lecanicillium saksenae]|uniref:Uncharacterized protein n=1 Tax=Lecanicillium saksenae TaxID=468837 RepID=A0ACC1QZY5_9HYPO|nr:hypothetical protein NLG97_g3282 [Lecanicillium saksenae]